MVPAFSQLFERLERWEKAISRSHRSSHGLAGPHADLVVDLSWHSLREGARRSLAHVREQLPNDASPVVVLGHKEPEMLAGFLGALGSGHPYIPVDDSLPAASSARGRAHFRCEADIDA